MTPDEREQFDLEIYFETKKTEHRGCLVDAADYLHLRDASRISRLVNPNDNRANTIFGEAMQLLQAFSHKHPKLAHFIWAKMTLKANNFLAFTGSELDFFEELGELADSAAREQLDVNFAISRRKSAEEIEQEAFEAFDRSRLQYERARALRRSGTTINSEEEKK